MKSLMFPRFGLRMIPVLLVHCLPYYPGSSAFLHMVQPMVTLQMLLKLSWLRSPNIFHRHRHFFANTNIHITVRSQRHVHLGAVLEFAKESVAGKVQSWVMWVSEVSALAQVAASWPHAAYSAFKHGFIGRWVYLMRSLFTYCEILSIECMYSILPVVAFMLTPYRLMLYLLHSVSKLLAMYHNACVFNNAKWRW